ncbi:MAG: polysaccharide deacetylase family protein [Micrococcales bacterium]|nr:polysaccharide deacetylase family protein [Micrococcales bacterium]
MIRRRYACAYEEGPRQQGATPALLRWGRPMIAPVTVLACAVTQEPVLALTYDDGPDPQTTPAVLDALAAGGAQATFFVLAEQAQAHPQVLRRIVADGHELALHGWDHRRLTTLPFAEAMGSIRRARRVVEDLVGVRLRLFRPAYGAQTMAMAVATRALGLDVVLWSAWARDWTAEPTDVLLERAAGAAHPGGILLLHDAAAGVGGGMGSLTGSTAVAAPIFDRGALTAGLLEQLSARGYRFETVSGLRSVAPAGRMLWAERRREPG